MRTKRSRPASTATRESTKHRSSIAIIPDEPDKRQSAYICERGIRMTKNIDKNAIRVYLAYLMHADEKGICWPLQDLIASTVELSVRTVKRSVQTLKKRGVMRRIKVGKYHRWQLNR